MIIGMWIHFVLYIGNELSALEVKNNSVSSLLARALPMRKIASSHVKGNNWNTLTMRGQ